MITYILALVIIVMALSAVVFVVGPMSDEPDADLSSFTAVGIIIVAMFVLQNAYFLKQKIDKHFGRIEIVYTEAEKSLDQKDEPESD